MWFREDPYEFCEELAVQTHVDDPVAPDPPQSPKP